MSRLEKVKAIENILKAFSKIEDNYPKLSRLIIVGDGTQKEFLKNYCKKNNILNVKFKGSISSSKINNYFQKSHVLLISSTSEPWGLVVNEALSSGIPVLGPSNIGSFEDLIINDKSGIVVANNSSNELFKGMKKIIFKIDKVYQLGKNGQKLISDNGWNINKTLETFDKIMKS